MKQGELQERFIDTKQYNAKNEVFLEQNQWPFSDELEKKKKKENAFFQNSTSLLTFAPNK